MEGIFNVVPIGKINSEMLNLLGLHDYDLESMESIEMMLYNCYTYRVNKGPIQGVYENGGIFNIFLPGDSSIPYSFTYRKAGQSLSFIVPSSHPNSRIRGLILRTVYAPNGNQWDPDIYTYISTVLSNDMKDMQMEVFPACYALPGAGEDIIWLSHWNLRIHQLEPGDEMHVIVYSENLFSRLPVFEIKEVGIRFLYEDQAQSNDEEVGVWI